MAARLDNIKSMRWALGKSQSEMAVLLGISTRAVQSYEQGWRNTPLHVRKSAALLLFLNWRKRQKRVVPCWELRDCDQRLRSSCPAYLFGAGEFCWLVNGTRSGGPGDGHWPTKSPRCQNCPVTQRWLGS